MTEQHTGATRGPGRPRHTDLDARILASVRDMIDRGEEVTLRSAVAASGASRAALYRRWPTLKSLIAAALDEGRESLNVPETVESAEAFVEALLHTYRLQGHFPLERFRARLRLGLEDAELQEIYWQAHVARRREPVAALLSQAVQKGILREDLHIDAVIDALSGVFYYQVVARGVDIADEAVQARCRAALEILVVGMLRTPSLLSSGCGGVRKRT